MCECVSACVWWCRGVLGARAEERDRESTCVVASFIPSQAAHAGRHSLKTALHFHLLLPLSRRARERSSTSEYRGVQDESLLFVFVYHFSGGKTVMPITLHCHASQ